MQPRTVHPVLCLVALLALSGGTYAEIRPQDDYYTFVNADWLENTPIPGNLPGLENFTQGSLDVSALLRDDLDALSESDSPRKPYERKLVDLYRSYMNVGQRDQQGVKPLEPDLKLIADIKDQKGLALALAELQKLGIGGPIVLAPLVDPKDSSRYIVTVLQYGLGETQAVLAGEDERSQKMRGLYQEHIANLFTLAGIPHGADRAPRVVELEQELARIQWTPAQNRNPQETYNLFTVARLQETLSNLPVKEMITVLGFPTNKQLVVQQPTYLEALNKLFVETDVAVWQDYLRMRVLAERAPLLSKGFRDEGQAYKVKKGESAKELPLWLKDILFATDKVKMMVGRFYVEHHFTDDDLAQITDIVNAIKEEYRVAIQGSTLFSEETKKQALHKLDKMRFALGYPKKWTDYSDLEIDPDDLIGNVRRIAQFDHQQLLAKLDKPVDQEEWAASPTQVNAFYQPSANKFIIMAAILQPPFFDSKWSEAANLGGIGFIIGHEVGHGFDDQGSQYDADGNLRNWWTDEDREKFMAIAKRAMEQANAYEILPGRFLNGKLELGEILGDLSGLHIAHAAAVRTAKSKGLDLEKTNREFFEQAAKVWRSKYREAMMLKLLETDWHPPGKYRVNGMFPNLDAFHELYQTKPGDGMYRAPEDRLRIW